MAGVKGKSGGPRANSGGARPGAGRPKKAPSPAPAGSPLAAPVEKQQDDPQAFLRSVMKDPGADLKLRIDAAKALIAAGKVEGKKGAQQASAEKVAGKFGARPAPLKVVGGRG